MKNERPDWEDLNAYVDGELSPRTASRVAKALAADSDVARQVVALTQLKTTLHDDVVAEDAPLSLDDLGIPASPVKRSWFGLGWPALAASLAVAGVLAIAALLPSTSVTNAPTWFTTYQKAHTAWATSDPAIHPEPVADPLLSGLFHVGPETTLPDLTAAKLTIGRVKVVSGGPGGLPALHVGYKGSRGCRISLWVSQEPAQVVADFTRHSYERLTAYSWRVGELTYVIMTEGMPVKRFEGIARAAYRYILEHRPLDKETRVALAQGRAESQPCAA